jgi:cephalosporin-C deacetylase-like acetyl esterase/lysophospholipase L1-like esterase
MQPPARYGCWARPSARASNYRRPLTNPDGIYRLGESVGWSIALPPSALPQEYHYSVRKNNLETIQGGTLEFASGAARIETRMDEPSMIYVEITSSDTAQKPMALGAAVAPERLQPSVPEPVDFDGFWRSKLRLLAAVPVAPHSTPGPSEKSGVDYATITLNGINGTHIHGQLARPQGPGKFPGLVIFQWASPPYPLQKPWVTDRAAEGWLALNIEPHDVLPDQPQAYYDALPASLKNYQAIGRKDRDRNYFLQMYLADYRAIEYLASRPDWDRKTLVVMGTSMGGQQSICAASLNPRVTAVIVDEPAGADSNGELHGRAAGYPNWPSDDPQVMRTALYFDIVNCASRVKAPSLVAMGFIDTTAPPVGIWTAFNQLRGPKQAMPMVDSPHNHLATPEQQGPYTQASAQWLNTLVKGGELFPRADRPYARVDDNSRIAHRQLLAKRKQGRIDIYFLGDPITRRWGAADPQYQDLLANWRRNFFGWNAADFGWGGETTENLLWRLTQGELDGVNPKVIVLLIGTNNVGRIAPLGDESARAAAVTAGIQEILRLCRQKAPAAQIVLMGILPRDDNPAVMPIIDRINRSIAGFADNRHIRYLNINRQLADEHGRLYDGMTDPDHLHLSAKAYQVWADALKPILSQALGSPAAVDAAPPPSADPSTEVRASRLQ